MNHKITEKLLQYTGPELAVQEILYGFVMALTFIVAARVGILSYISPWELVTMIVAMNFVWGAIDMVIFYRIDVATQKRYAKLIRQKRDDDEYRQKIYDELDSTIFDVLAEEDKIKGVDVVINGKVETHSEMKSDRKNMMYSSISCFFITLLTTLPVIIALVTIDKRSDALDAAAILASISLFFVGSHIDPAAGKGKRFAEGLMIMLFALFLSIFAAYIGG
ncbi:MAG: hypothetical protein KRP56_07110 [Candidatus Methanogranum gryphiswaldense]|nr:MAG: hypothetical protein KRP56_07110 [Candidatus Methanogranum sp. U3.2.1]